MNLLPEEPDAAYPRYENWARPGLWGLRGGNSPVLPGPLRPQESIDSITNSTSVVIKRFEEIEQSDQLRYRSGQRISGKNKSSIKALNGEIAKFKVAG
ncbi:MAG: hypothetical protein LBC19_09485 [Tannerella sp.]|nr:hypothetical protein [Tannerella sp.]